MPARSATGSTRWVITIVRTSSGSPSTHVLGLWSSDSSLSRRRRTRTRNGRPAAQTRFLSIPFWGQQLSVESDLLHDSIQVPAVRDALEFVFETAPLRRSTTCLTAQASLGSSVSRVSLDSPHGAVPKVRYRESRRWSVLSGVWSVSWAPRAGFGRKPQDRHGPVPGRGWLHRAR